MIFGSPQIVQTGLVSHYDFTNPLCYTSGSSTLYDIGGNNNKSSIFAVTSSVSNPYGLVLNGTSSFITASDATSFRSSNFTVSSWCKPLGLASTGQAIFAKSYTTGWGSPYVSYFCRISTTQIEPGTSNGSAYSPNAFSYTSLQNNTIYNFVFSYDGSNKRIYINNILVNTTSNTSGIGYSNGPFSIGADTSNGANLGGDFFNGVIYNTSVYNRALSVAEIAQNYNAMRVRFNI